MTEREFDVVLYGASGFTGKLVAERLLQRAPQGTRIALAGRSLAKLGSVRSGLGPGAADWPLLLADSDNKSTLTRLARSTVALATTVGPYSTYGLPMVEACAKSGTHYVDLTGEVLFMRHSADAYHEVAQGTGARIVHACGFDSIPSDLGVLLLHGVAGPLAETTLLVKSARGSFSGGTVASGRAQADSMVGDPEARALLADPYSLSPDRAAEPDPGDQGDLSGAVHHRDLGWLSPFVMGPTNTRVVRRSNALAGYPYSRDFRYEEALSFGEGVIARAKATGVGAGASAFWLAMNFGPTRVGMNAVMDQVLPKPSQGPGPDARAAGHFTMQIHGYRPDGQHFVATVAAQGDPGYAATSLMLAESVLLAASDDPALPDRAGVLTPATAFGMPLVERLRAAGMTFEAGPADAGDDSDAGQPADEDA